MGGFSFIPWFSFCSFLIYFVNLISYTDELSSVEQMLYSQEGSQLAVVDYYFHNRWDWFSQIPEGILNHVYMGYGFVIFFPCDVFIGFRHQNNDAGWMEWAKKKLFLPLSSENIWVGLVLFCPFKFLGKKWPGCHLYLSYSWWGCSNCGFNFFAYIEYFSCWWLLEIILVFVFFKEFVHFIYVVECISMKVYNIFHAFRSSFK